MCFGLGIGCLLALIEILPYICLVIVPFLGSFYGVETIYCLSILLIIHSFLVECIPRFLFQVVPLLNLLLFILLAYLPLSLTPWQLVWVYDKVMWLSYPVLMIAEVILLQNFVMRQSQSAADEIETDEDSAYFYKGAILLFSSLCYAVAASLAYDIFTKATGSQVVCLFVTISILIAIHNMMLMAHEGIISDCAFATLLSVTIIYTMTTEAEQIKSPLPEPYLWQKTTDSSLVTILNSILHMSSGHAQRSISFLKRFFSPFFMGLLAVRLYSILFIVHKVTCNFFRDRPEDDDFNTIIQNFDEEQNYSAWKSPLLLKVSIIFMLTQITGLFLEEWSGNVDSLSWLAESTKHVWPTQILIGRLVQVLAVNGFYMWRLYRAEDWTWNPWLTPTCSILAS